MDRRRILVTVGLVAVACQLAAITSVYHWQTVHLVDEIAHRGRRRRPRRRRPGNRGMKFHVGPGIWDDYKDLFTRGGRRRLGRRRVRAMAREFQHDFRLTVHSFSELMDHCREELSGSA